MKKALVFLLLVLVLIFSGCGLVSGDFVPEVIRPSVPVTDCGLPAADGAEIVLKNPRKIQPYRAHYGLGTCHTFSGRQVVVLFFVDDGESSWTEEEIRSFTSSRVVPALEFLQKEAKEWNVDLSFEIKRYSLPLSGVSTVYEGCVIKDLSISGSTKDLPLQMAERMGFSSAPELLRALMEEFETDSVISLFLLDKNGVSYARNQLVEGLHGHVEHSVIFSDRLEDPSGAWLGRTATVAHEILHLFGCEDYYLTDARLRLSEQYFKDDIMLLDTHILSGLAVREYSAFCLGWTDEIPEICSEEGWY